MKMGSRNSRKIVGGLYLMIIEIGGAKNWGDDLCTHKEPIKYHFQQAKHFSRLAAGPSENSTFMGGNMDL